MGNAPKSIWAQDAQPDECDYTGGGWWDDACGNTQYSHMVEYIRTDIHQSEIERLTTALETARADALREAAEICEENRRALDAGYDTPFEYYKALQELGRTRDRLLALIEKGGDA